jgi:ATP-dependent Lon protease
LVKTSHLLAPFPEDMIDSAFFDRFHAYIPGWEIPKMRPEFFTDRYGLIVDYLAEYFREMRKRSFSDAIDRFFKLGSNLNQRDVIAVRKTVSGMLKLLYPHAGSSHELTKEEVRPCLEYALQVRRRVKEQLKKIGGMEFYDVHFSYIDNESLEEHFVTVKEQGGGALIPEGPGKPGFIHTIGLSNKGVPGLYRLELQVTKGSGKLATSGLWNSTAAKEQVKIAFDYFKANASRISGSAKVMEHDFHLHVVELQNTGPLNSLALSSLVAFASGLMGKPAQAQMVVLGDMSLGGSITPVQSIAECLQVAFDGGGKRVALPMTSAADIPSIPAELFTKFQTSFYADPVDAVFKVLGVD